MTPLLNQRGMVGGRSCVFSTILRLVLTPAFWNAPSQAFKRFLFKVAVKTRDCDHVHPTSGTDRPDIKSALQIASLLSSEGSCWSPSYSYPQRSRLLLIYFPELLFHFRNEVFDSLRCFVIKCRRPGELTVF